MWGWAVATLSTGLASEMPLPHCATGHKSSKGGAWEHVTTKILPWQATDPVPWYQQLPSYLTLWMCFDTYFLDTYLHHSPSQCHNTPSCFLSRLVKRYFPTATKLFPIHLHLLHSPTLLLQLCNDLTSVRLLAVISFLVLLPAGCISLLFLAHFKFPGTTIFLFSVHTVPSTARYQIMRKALDITICQIRDI